METFEELITALRRRLVAESNSTFYTEDVLKDELNASYRWVASLFLWKETEKARVTSTKSGFDYYDYPEDFLTDSIERMTVNGLEYSVKNFSDFLKYREDNPNDSTKLFADYARQYFVFPTPLTDGTNNISVWGHVQVAKLVNTTDKTVFSTSNIVINEAIIKKAFGVLAERGGKKGSELEQTKEATDILLVQFDKQKKRSQTAQRLDHPFFDVPDFFGSGVSNIGKFSV